MTRDEVFRLVRSAIDTRLSFSGMPDDEWDDVAEAVLAAFAARGIVLGETEELSKPDHYEIFDKYPEAYNNPEWSKAELSKRGLALVRVVE